MPESASFARGRQDFALTRVFSQSVCIPENGERVFSGGIFFLLFLCWWERFLGFLSLRLLSWVSFFLPGYSVATILLDSGRLVFLRGSCTDCSARCSFQNLPQMRRRDKNVCQVLEWWTWRSLGINNRRCETIGVIPSARVSCHCSLLVGSLVVCAMGIA